MTIGQIPGMHGQRPLALCLQALAQ
jgi:hypothetical protein